MVSGKSKGNSFEREICKKLSLWWTNGKRDDIFWRSQNSGGRATVRGKSGKRTSNQSGDVSVANDEGIGKSLLRMVAIELKRGYPTVGPIDLLDHTNPKNEFFTWVEQAKAAAANSKAFGWWIIHKKNRRKAMIYMPFKVFMKTLEIGVPDGLLHCRKMELKIGGLEIVGMELETYWKYFTSPSAYKRKP